MSDSQIGKLFQALGWEYCNSHVAHLWQSLQWHPQQSIMPGCHFWWCVDKNAQTVKVDSQHYMLYMYMDFTFWLTLRRQKGDKKETKRRDSSSWGRKQTKGQGWAHVWWDKHFKTRKNTNRTKRRKEKKWLLFIFEKEKRLIFRDSKDGKQTKGQVWVVFWGQIWPWGEYVNIEHATAVEKIDAQDNTSLQKVIRPEKNVTTLKSTSNVVK